MKIKNIIFSSLGTLIFLFAFNFYTPNHVLSSAGDTILGYAWNDTVGWISFNNCTSTQSSSCTGVNYGVTGADNGQGAYILSGYAWNDNIGWISFESSDVASCNNGSPRLMANPGFAGSAKILSLGNSGCIDLAGVTLVPGSSNSFQGYAWNDTIGWVDFTGVGIGQQSVPSISITSTPSSVYPSSNINLTWTGQNLTGFSCTASNSASLPDWTGSKATSGTATVNVGSGWTTKTYTITCTNSTTSQTLTSNTNVSIISGIIIPWFGISVPYPASFVEGGANVSFDIPLTVVASSSTFTLYTDIGSSDSALSGSTYELLYNGNPVPRAQPDPTDPVNPYDPRFLSTNTGNFVIRMTIPRDLVAGSSGHRVNVVSTTGAETHTTYFDVTPLAQVPAGVCSLNGVVQGGTSGSSTRSGSVSVSYVSPITTHYISCTVGGGPGGSGGNIGVHFTGGDTKNSVSPSGLRLSAFPQVVDPNSTTLLRWDGENVNNCIAYTGAAGAAGGIWTGQKNSSGTETITMGTTAQLFTIECRTSSGKSAIASTIVGIKGVEPGLFVVGNPLTGKGGRLLWRFGTNILPAPFYKEE